MSKRKRRRGEVTCRCGAYHFPHRFSGGRCNGRPLAVEAVNNGHRECRDCRLYCPGEMEPPCEVAIGQEHPRECPVVQDFCHVHEIKLTSLKETRP